MECNCNDKEDILAIQKGNDFRLHICGGDIVPGASHATFADVSELKAYIVSFPYRRDEVNYLFEETAEPTENPATVHQNGVGYISEFPVHKHYGVVSPNMIYTDITLEVPADIQRCTVYGIEITGNYGGRSWRWKAKEAFRIVDSNCDATMQGNETYGVETYYLMRDILEVETDGDTMYITTHGHASLIDRTLALQDTEHTEVTLEGDTLVFTLLD